MILVTGAAGLIGSAVVRELNSIGRDDLYLVDHLGESDKWKNLLSLKYADYFEKHEFLSLLNASPPYFKGISAIIHLGACSSTTEKNATYLVENNIRYSQHLANFAWQYQIRMVYASSAATYGDGLNGFDDDVTQLTNLRPLNAYGWSKHAFDVWLNNKNYFKTPIFAGIKYFNVFGPNEYHKGDMQSLVLKAYHQILNSGTIRLFKSYRNDYKDGEQMRDFYYVKDAAKLTVFLALKNRRASGIFNAGSGVATKWNDLAGAIFSAMGREVSIEYIDMPDSLKSKYQYYTLAPVERIRQAEFTLPATPLQDAVKDYVQEYLLKDERHA